MAQEKTKKRWPRTPPTRADSRAIVDAVIEAASGLPVAEVSMRVLAERAGVGVASIYRYFPTKQAIYAEISRRLLERFVRDVEQIVAEDPPLEQAVRRVCAAAVIGQGDNLSMRRTLNLDVPQAWTHDASSAAVGRVSVLLARFVAGKISPPVVDIEARVRGAFAALRGLLLFSLLYSSSGLDTEKLIDEMTETALLLLLRPPIDRAQREE